MSSSWPPPTADEWDDDLERDLLARQLLEAARLERPSPAARQRALESLSRSRPRRPVGRWLLAALTLGSVCLVATRWVSSEGVSVRIAPDRAVAPRMLHDAAPQVTELTAPHSPRAAEDLRAPARETAERRRAVAPDSSPIVAAPPSAPESATPASLETELELLDRARRAQLAGNAEEALRTLAQYDRQAPARHLGSEATLLRIQVLATSGRLAEASALASDFVTRNPHSPLVDRAKSFIETPPGGIKEEGAEP